MEPTEGSMTRPSEIIDKFRVGDSLTDEECKIGAGHFRKMAQMLSVSGLTYKSAFNSADSIATALEGFLEARARYNKNKAPIIHRQDQ